MSDTLGSAVAAGDVTLADAVQAFVRFGRVLRRRVAWLGYALLGTALLGGLYYATAPRVYQATASLLITQSGPDVWSTAPATGNVQNSFIPTYEQLFTSAVVLEGALERLKRMPSEARIDLAQSPREKWTLVLRERLSVRSIRRTNVIELAYRSQSPAAAKAVLNAVVDSYMEFMERHHKDASIQLVTLLEQQRRETADQLQQKQQHLLDVKRQAGVVVREGNDIVHPVVQRVIQLNEILLETQKQRIELEASHSAIRSAIEQGGDLREHLLTVEPMVGRELIMSALGLNPQYAELAGQMERQLIEDRAKWQTLRQYYGPAHHEMVELEERIRSAEQYLAEHQQRSMNQMREVQSSRLGPLLLAMVQEKLAKTRQQEDELRREYDRAEAAAIQLNDRLAELQMAENDVHRLRNLHDMLLDRIANIDLNQNRTNVQVAIVSKPKSTGDPVSPQLLIVVLACLVTGSGAGTLLIYVADLLDERFRSPDELRRQTGLPMLALIRRLPSTGQSGSQAVQLHADPTMPEAEAFRTLRTALALRDLSSPCVAVTSAEPGDGKTTVLANLAAAYAQAGKRILAVDADLRRPGLSKLFQLRGPNGLSDLLRGPGDVAALVAERICPSGIEGLDILPCGPRPADPTNLLSQPRFAELIAWAESQYDLVLIDCPPVLAAADATVVGRLVESVLLVVQPAKNHRRLVMRAVEELASLQIAVSGIVANVVSESGEHYYGYGTEYGYGYGETYHDEDDRESDASGGSDLPSPHDETQRVVPRRAA